MLLLLLPPPLLLLNLLLLLLAQGPVEHPGSTADRPQHQCNNAHQAWTAIAACRQPSAAAVKHGSGQQQQQHTVSIPASDCNSRQSSR